MSGLDTLLVQFRPPGGGDALTVPCPSDLRFDRSTPGGYKALSCSLVLPAGTATPPALGVLAEVRVIDGRTGGVVWFGELTDPGLSVRPDGQHFAVTAAGGQSRLDGWREVFLLVDRAQESWQAVGDFSSASSGFGGDLTPYDVNLGDIDLGDLGDFGGELGIDFGDGIDFGGDLGGGNIDFSGQNYPPLAGYPGYLGYLKDPSGNPGDMLPIPLGIGAGWEEGTTASGGSAVDGGPSAVSLAAGSGLTTRHRISGGLMMTPSYMEAGSTFWSSPPTTYDPNVIRRVVATVLLGTGAAARMMLWADGTLTQSGYVARAGMDGTFSLLRVEGGSETVLDTVSWTPSTTETYMMFLSIGADLTQYSAALLSGPYDVSHTAPTVSASILQVSDFTEWDLTYTYPAASYQVVNPLGGQETSWFLHDGTYWGVGAETGSVDFSAVDAVGTGTPE